MYKAFKCKHCGKTEREHAAFKETCLVNGREVHPEQKFEADPEKFVVYTNAPRPRTSNELMAGIGGNGWFGGLR